MNKLVIVGNGFDKAHGLPTSYCDFINYFWTKFPSICHIESIKQLVTIDESYLGFMEYDSKVESYATLQSNLKKYASDYSYHYDDDICHAKNGHVIFKISNEFLKIISKKSIQNWVDIESEYYNLLVAIINKQTHIYLGDIEKLNNEFEQIKTILEKYLCDEIANKFNFTINNQNSILNLFRLRPQSLEYDNYHPIFLEFPKEVHRDLIDFDTQLGVYYNDFDTHTVHWPEVLFLNFNYTQSVKPYIEAINQSFIREYGKNAKQIHIHGQLNSKDNPINFGFGDEMDDHYRLIEKDGNNSYMKNIKSFQYLHNSNYRHLLNWIESNDFQVYIFGHSCGMSDRTMLNTIFEHDCCKSIKIFYHKNGNSDNFTEITHNISRQFDDKKKMRSKIVDKSLSSELPQDVNFSVKI